MLSAKDQVVLSKIRQSDLSYLDESGETETGHTLPEIHATILAYLDDLKAEIELLKAK